jgi:glycosyltransferase involved in cell wall biosynthesis
MSRDGSSDVGESHRLAGTVWKNREAATAGVSGIQDIPAASPPVNAAQEGMPDLHLIFVSMEDWDDVWRRNQFICMEIARKSKNRRILFVGVQRNLLRCLRRWDWRALFTNPTWTVPGYPNIAVTTALRAFPERYQWGLGANEWITRRHVRKVAASLRIHDPVLWLNPHTAVHMLGRMGERAVIYDITDDWEEMNQSPSAKEVTKAQDARFGAEANAIIVCSPALLASKEAKFQRRVHLVPNGVDAEHYRPVADASLPVPVQARDWRKPVLGYTGTVHPERVDVALVAALAERFAHGSIVLIGPNLLQKDDRQRLGKYTNVHMPGAVPYREIPDWMRAFDVCIVPHLVTPFTESLNPIKLWEYLAAGKPIISTPVAGFRDYPGLVRLAEDAESFARQVNAGLAEDSALAESRRTEARKHSWCSRVEQIEAIIQSCLTR